MNQEDVTILNVYPPVTEFQNTQNKNRTEKISRKIQNYNWIAQNLFPST